MPDDDPVDDTSMIFTEGDVYMIMGFLADKWGCECVTEDIEEAIKEVLGAQND
jgi:hypothetical protein